MLNWLFVVLRLLVLLEWLGPINGIISIILLITSLLAFGSNWAINIDLLFIKLASSTDRQLSFKIISDFLNTSSFEKLIAVFVLWFIISFVGFLNNAATKWINGKVNLSNVWSINSCLSSGEMLIFNLIFNSLDIYIYCPSGP